MTVDEAERRLIEITLDHTGGNKTRAAEMLGISLKTLHNKLNRMKAEAASATASSRRAGTDAISIKAKQVAGVTVIVGLAVVAAERVVRLVAGAASGSRRPSRAPTCSPTTSTSGRST